MSCDVGVESFEDIVTGRMGSCWSRLEKRRDLRSRVLGEGLRDSYPRGWEQTLDKI